MKINIHDNQTQYNISTIGFLLEGGPPIIIVLIYLDLYIYVFTFDMEKKYVEKV